MTGSIITVLAAINPPNSALYSPRKSANPSETVYLSLSLR